MTPGGVVNKHAAVTVLAGLSRRLISSVLIAGGLASGGCLPTDDLADYSEQWSNAFGGSGGSGNPPPVGNDGLAGGDAGPGGTQQSDGGPMVMSQGDSGGTSSGDGDDAGLDAGATGVADAADAAAPDACADAAPGSPGCGS